MLTKCAKTIVKHKENEPPWGVRSRPSRCYPPDHPPRYRLRSFLATPLALKALFPSSWTFFPSSLLLFLLPSFLPSFPSSVVFGIYRARIVGGAREPSRDQLLGPTPTILQLRLKIALFFDAVFLPFWDDLGTQDRPKIAEKRHQKT